MKTLGVLLAAGQSRRFGASDKLLADWQGRPLVTWPAQALRDDAGCTELAAVTSSARVAALLPGFVPLHLPAGSPMSESFALAARHAQRIGAEALLLVLGDMPGVTGALLRQLSGQRASTACLWQDRRMPPALLVGTDIAAALDQPPGDYGARRIITRLPPDRLIPISAGMARDIDHPQDLAP